MNFDGGFKKTAVQFGLSFLGGLYSVFISLLMVLPHYDSVAKTWGGIASYFFYTLRNGTAFWGIGLAIVAGIFFGWCYTRAQKKWQGTEAGKLKKLKMLIIVFLWFAGMLSFQPLSRIAREHNLGRLPVVEVDENNDGKTDKWIHRDVNQRLVEIDYDRNGDGKADVFEYYGKNGELTRKTVLKLKR